MGNQSYKTSFLVDRTPREVFDSINNARGWWAGDIEGDTDRLGAVFTYRVPEVHYAKLKITELIPGRKVVWHVLESDISYAEPRDEWDDTQITFEISAKRGKTEIRFTHVGLVPEQDCYESCADAWRTLVNGSLRKLITTGKPQPNPFAARV